MSWQPIQAHNFPHAVSSSGNHPEYIGYPEKFKRSDKSRDIVNYYG